MFPHVTFHGISIPHVRSQGRVMEMVEWNGNAVGASIWLYLRLIPSRHDRNTLPAISLMHAFFRKTRANRDLCHNCFVVAPYVPNTPKYGRYVRCKTQSFPVHVYVPESYVQSAKGKLPKYLLLRTSF